MPRRKSNFSFFLIVLLLLLLFLMWRTSRRPVNTSGHRPTTVAPRGAPRYPETTPPSLQTRRPSGQINGTCASLGVACATEYFAEWTAPQDNGCHTTTRNGYTEPDPACTPGGVNPTVTAEILRNPDWTTRCVRNCASSEAQKHITYGWYGLPLPQHNSGANQVCELDHLVPLELGGADALGNIWPECGPDQAQLNERYFKVKDRVENYLADEVRAGRMSLDEAQRGIASDWTQYLGLANKYCGAGGRC